MVRHTISSQQVSVAPCGQLRQGRGFSWCGFGADLALVVMARRAKMRQGELRGAESTLDVETVGRDLRHTAYRFSEAMSLEFSESVGTGDKPKCVN